MHGDKRRHPGATEAKMDPHKKVTKQKQKEMQAGFTKAKEISEAEREWVAGAIYRAAGGLLVRHGKGSTGRVYQVTRESSSLT